MAQYPTFPELSRAPSFDEDREHVDPTLRDEMANGMEDTRPKFTRRRRQWDVGFDNLSADDIAALDAFTEREVVYGAGMFYFPDALTDPKNPVSLLVRFSELPKHGKLVWADDALVRPTRFQIREV